MNLLRFRIVYFEEGHEVAIDDDETVHSITFNETSGQFRALIQGLRPEQRIKANAPRGDKS